MAEGLIPFVYRAIKRRKAVRRYHSLSSSASAAAGAAAAAIVAAGRISDGQAAGAHAQYNYRQPERGSLDGRPWTPATLQLGGGGGGGRKADGQHRRRASVDDFAYEEEYRRQQQYYYDGYGPAPQQPPLAKTRSTRVFSCITGM